MDREVFFTVGSKLVKVVNNKSLRCKECDQLIPFCPATKQELRHACVPNDDWEYDDELADHADAVDEDSELLIGNRIHRGFDLRGYGEGMEAFDGVYERW